MLQNISQKTLTIRDVVPIYRNTFTFGIFLDKIEISNETQKNIRYTISIALRDGTNKFPKADAPKQHFSTLVTLRGRVSIRKKLGFNLMPFEEIRVYAENDVIGDDTANFLVSVNLWGDI